MISTNAPQGRRRNICAEIDGGSRISRDLACEVDLQMRLGGWGERVGIPRGDVRNTERPIMRTSECVSRNICGVVWRLRMYEDVRIVAPSYRTQWRLY